MQGGNPRGEGALFIAALALAGVAAAVLIAVLIAGGDLVDAGDDLLPFLFGAAAIVALLGWMRRAQLAGRREAASEEERRRLEAQAEEREREASERLEQREQEL